MTGLEKQPNGQESRQGDYRNIITELEMKIILVFLIFHDAAKCPSLHTLVDFYL